MFSLEKHLWLFEGHQTNLLLPPNLLFHITCPSKSQILYIFLLPSKDHISFRSRLKDNLRYYNKKSSQTFFLMLTVTCFYTTTISYRRKEYYYGIPHFLPFPVLRTESIQLMHISTLSTSL